MTKTLFDELDNSKSYKLRCGHNNGGILNVWPFRTMLCLDCGFRTDRKEDIIEVN